MMAEHRESIDDGVDEEVLVAFDCAPTHIRRFDAVWQLFTPAGQLELTKIKHAGSHMQTAFQLSERLAGNNCPHAAPRMIRSRYNDPYLRDGDAGYYLTTWPEGQVIDTDDREELMRVTRALAGWHRAAKRAPLTVSGDEPRLSDWWDAATSALLAAGGLEAAKQMLTDAGWFEADEQAAAAGWLCHGLLVPKQVRRGQIDYRILHYEHVFAGHPLFDFACFVTAVLPNFNWDKDLLQEMIGVYETQLPELAWSRAQLAALLQIPFTAVERAMSSQTSNISGIADTFSVEPSAAQLAAIQSLMEREAPIQHADMTERDQDLILEPASARPRREPVRIKRYRPKPEPKTGKKTVQPKGLHLFMDQDD